MNRWLSRLRVTLALLSGAGVAWGARHWLPLEVTDEEATAETLRTGSDTVSAPYAAFARVAVDALDSVIERLPFDDPALPVDPVETTVAEVTAAVAVELPLSLTGVVVGTVNQALIAGLPGTSDSKALRVGDRMGSVRLLHVDSTQAIVEIDGERRVLRIKEPGSR